MLDTLRQSLWTLYDDLFGERKIREVSCLFATRNEHVLLATRDGVHWHFPQEEVRGSAEGNPVETPIGAIHRIVAELDEIDEDDVVIEGSGQFLSHHGVITEYHIFMSHSKLSDGEIKTNGCTLEWTDDPHSKNLNECTRERLKYFGYYPKTK
jgi:hypothetical protein